MRNPGLTLGVWVAFAVAGSAGAVDGVIETDQTRASGSGGRRASGYRAYLLADNDPNNAEVQPIVSEAGGQILNLGNNVCGGDTTCP